MTTPAGLYERYIHILDEIERTANRICDGTNESSLLLICKDIERVRSLMETTNNTVEALEYFNNWFYDEKVQKALTKNKLI